MEEYDRIYQANIFSMALQFFLDDRKWTVRFLQSQTGISSNTIYKCRKKGYLPKMETLLEICDVLGVRPSEFLKKMEEIKEENPQEEEE